MRIARALAVTALIAVVVVLGSSGGHAQGPATVFLGIGDLADGGANSIVQEATQVGSTIYAVGASTRTATGTIPSLDTAVTWDSVTNALVIVPDLAVFNPLPTNANSVIYAVTPDALYMAGRLRSDASNISLSNGFKALRTLGGLRTVGAFTALDISDSPLNPNIVYGQQSGGAGAPAGVNNSRAIRFDTSGPSNTAVQVPLLTTNLAGGCVLLGSNPVPPPPQTCLDNLPAYRGMSSDGSVLVGTAFTGLFQGGQNQYLTTNGLAFRWDVVNQPNAVTEIPRPTGGTWSSAIAVSTNGNLTLAGGNSNDYPLGEVWIHNATTDAIQELGSPNTQFTPRLYGGMTADGSVIGVTFMGSGPTQSPTFANNPTQYAYLHNSHGWFHLANVLTAQGVNLWGTAASPGWDPANMILTGIRTVDTDNNGTADVDLVFGQGRRRNLNGSAGAPEGFVASFPVGVLAAYQLPAPAPVANNALVGAWALGSDPNNPLSVMVLLADGTYYTTMSRNRALTAGYGTGAGNFERGVYTLTGGNAVTFTTTEDRDGAGPHQSGSTPATFVFNGQVSSLNGRQSLSVNFTSADTFTVEDATCSPVCSVFQGTRITGASGSIAGAWTANNPPFFPDGRFIIVLLNSNAGSKYYEIADGTLENQNDGGEGTYVWDANLHQFTLTPSDGGSPDVVDASPTSDELGLFINDPPDSFTLTRIVNPDTVLPSITNATLAAKGSPGAAFSYTVTAVKAVTFGATDLPAGLTIDASSGVISGTTAQSGVFNVQVTATNTLGDTDTETLVLTFTDAPAAFHGIGDLPTGAVGSAVRDATRVNGNLYAVGASSARDIVFCTSPNVPSGCLNAGSTFPNLDSPVWWRWTGSGAGTLAALPEVPVHDPLLAPTNQIFAYAITPDARYIAGQAHFTANSTGTQWVRDTNVGGTLSILSVGANIPQVAYAMSDDGATVYGTRSSIGARIDIVGTGAPGTTVTVTTPLPLPAGTTVSQPVARGTSSNGAVMVGVASNGALAATNGVAFRYTKATNTIGVIPMLMGGTWNYPVAVSASGAQTVVAGNSSDFPNGEVYLTDSANAITATLGSPNDLLVPKMLGGITADGAIAVTFGTGGNNPSVIPTGGRYAYIHNSHGWFSLSSVLAAQNIDLVVEDWDPTNMLVTGVRTVEGVDLVFGQGRRRSVGAAGYVSGAQEGFVVELPSGTLAAFNPQPAAPTDQSIVGTWLIGTDPANPTSVLSTFADGTFIRINLNLANGGPNGIERGLYSWAGNAAGGAYATTTLYDTDGTFGNSGTNGFLGRTVIVTGDTLTLTDTNCPGCTVTAFQRVAASAGSIVGGWVGPYPPTADSFVMAVFTGATGGNKYYFGTHGPDWGGDDVENGTFTWDAGTHTLLTVNSGGVPDSDPTTATLAHDELGLQIAVTYPGPVVETFDLTRVVAPSTVTPQLTPPAQVNALVNAPFSYVVPSTHARTFAASGLPDGLSLNTATGEISGTPTTLGISTVNVTATNTFGSPGAASFDINAMGTPVITSPLTLSASIDVPFSYTVTATHSPTTFGATGLPAGLSIDTATGAITGTPTEFGIFNVGLSATNPVATGNATLVLTITAVPGITSALSVSGTIDVPFTYTITATRTPTLFGATGLPAGLSLNTATGEITGTPTEFGVFTVGLTAANSVSEGGATLNLTITAVPVVTSLLTLSAPIDVPFSYTVTATHSPTTFGATGLPAGLAINTSTGAITGTPTEFGVFTVNLTVANSVSEGSATLDLTITAVPVFTSSLFVTTPADAAFAYAITATYSPTTFSATGLPPGLGIDTNTGAITGTPTTPGYFPVAISAANSISTGYATLNLTISSVAPTGTGSNVTVTPEVPAGTPEVSLQFETVSGGGETSVALIAPEVIEALPELPPNLLQVEVGGQSLVYQIETTATVSGPVDICFTYPPDAFVGETPRLLHFDHNALPEPGQWIDVTSSVDEANNVICGTVESFSPFVIVKTETPTPFLGTTSIAITFEGGPYVYRGSAFTATAVATSDDGFSQSVPVIYTGDCLNASLTGCTATATFAGITTPGVGSYSGSTDSAKIFISKVPSSTVVTFEPGPYTYRGSAFTATAHVTGVGLDTSVPVSYGGNCLNVTGPDGCTASASFAGDRNHTGSNGGASITIQKAPATVTLSNMTQTFTSGSLAPTVTTTPLGLSYTLIGAPQIGPGSFTVTATITAANYSGSASGTFVIASTTPLTANVISPNGLEQRFIGVPTTIRWNVTGATSIDVALSRDGGHNYTNIAGCTGLPGSATSCAWTPTGPATIMTKVRVTARGAGNTTAISASALPFILTSGSPSVKVQLPTGQATWAIGTTKPIAWTHNLGANAAFRIELSRNNGGTWETLAASADGALLVLGGFPWEVTGPTTANAKIRITSLDSPASNTSSTFAIVSPAVTVTVPNANVSWSRNSQKTITWNHNLGTGTSIKVELSRDGGTTWTTLAASVANSGATTGSYNWTVAGPTTTTARIRVSWTTDANVKDTSDVNFKIQ